jgi:hypothetical protein
MVARSGREFAVAQWRARAAYDNYVSEVTKLGELYSDLAREAFKPYRPLLQE